MSAPIPAPSALVGRDRELAILREQLDAAIVGHGSLVLIGGEAGIGKTALAEALCREAGARDALVLIGRCYDLTETPPYGPWVELFGQNRAADGPPLPDAFAHRGTVGEVTSQTALFQQVTDFFTTLADRRPVVLLLDDMHWSDPASLELLRDLARSVTTRSLLILVTYRSDEMTRHHPLSALLPTLVREAAAERLNLRPLDDAAVDALVTARYHLQERETARLVAYLQARAEGNAFFLGELVRSLEEADVLRQDPTSWVLGDLNRIGVPALLRQVIEGRLARLGESAQSLLEVGAVIGQEIPLALWSTVTTANDTTLLAVVERAVEAHVLEASPAGMSVHFVHALTRETLYEGILPPRRRVRHREVAEALIAEAHPDPDAVAFHLSEAGDERAVPWLVQAGERAQRAFAWLTAAQRFEAALALMERYGAASSERGWLLYRLAILRRFAAPTATLATLEAARRCAAEAGDPVLAAHALYYQGVNRCGLGDIRRGLPQLRAGVEAVEQLSPAETAWLTGRDILERSAGRGTLIMWLGYTGRFSEACTMGEQYLAALEARPANTPMPGSVAPAHAGLAYAYAHLGRVAEARRAFTATQEAYRAIGYPYHLSGQLMFELQLLVLPYQADDIALRGAVGTAAEEEWARANDIQANRPAGVPSLLLLFLEGRWREVARLVPALSARTSSNAHLEVIVAQLAWAQGDTARAWSLVQERLPEGPASVLGDTRSVAAPMQRLAATLALDAGDLPTAKEWLDAHDRWLAWSGAVLGRSEGHLGWGMYFRAAGDPANALAHAQLALAHATHPRQPLALLAAHRLLGELDTIAGRFEDATAHLEQSLLLATACATPFERALTLLAWANLDLAMGKIAAAGTLLDEIRAICIPLDAKPTLARAEALDTRLAQVTDAPPTYPASLSAREVEVLRLLAAGKTNREIAATLFVSVNTVRIHVVHILQKTDTANRAAAASFAHAHGLV
jgi:DNA-binding CsgD family transcriptional regulator